MYLYIGNDRCAKGVLVPHRAWSGCLKDDYASFERDDVFLQMAPLSFMHRRLRYGVLC